MESGNVGVDKCENGNHGIQSRNCKKEQNVLNVEIGGADTLP